MAGHEAALRFAARQGSNHRWDRSSGSDLPRLQERAAIGVFVSAIAAASTALCVYVGDVDAAFLLAVEAAAGRQPWFAVYIGRSLMIRMLTAGQST